MLNKIKEYLQASDIEMVKLGAVILQTDKTLKWKLILDRYLNKNFIYYFSRTDEDEMIINISYRPNRGLWEQLESGNKFTYHASNFTLETIKEVVDNLYENKTK